MMDVGRLTRLLYGWIHLRRGKIVMLYWVSSLVGWALGAVLAGEDEMHGQQE